MQRCLTVRLIEPWLQDLLSQVSLGSLATYANAFSSAVTSSHGPSALTLNSVTSGSTDISMIYHWTIVSPELAATAVVVNSTPFTVIFLSAVVVMALLLISNSSHFCIVKGRRDVVINRKSHRTRKLFECHFRIDLSLYIGQMLNMWFKAGCIFLVNHWGSLLCVDL